MSQEVEIIEGARGRSFSRVNRIKTDKQDGGACFWVPENERRLTSLYAFQNGEYEPGNGYYAFDSVDASVMHFDDFDINIDDYDLPHIDLDGIDITIDETGIPHIGFDYEIVTVDDETIKVIYPDGKEVIIHGPDLDGLINIDDVFTIDYDKETGTWTITAIVNVTSGDNEFAPGDIVAQWPGTEHVDIHISQSISIPDLGDIDLDFDADIDVSVDLDDMDVDISGIDMDGLDVDVNIDLDTLNIDTFELPDEIRIMHVPNKTSYKDGEEIDLDGLVVQAYRNGEVWQDEDGKHWQGYIPVHELIASRTSDKHVNSDIWDDIPILISNEENFVIHFNDTLYDGSLFAKEQIRAYHPYKNTRIGVVPCFYIYESSFGIKEDNSDTTIAHPIMQYEYIVVAANTSEEDLEKSTYTITTVFEEGNRIESGNFHAREATYNNKTIYYSILGSYSQLGKHDLNIPNSGGIAHEAIDKAWGTYVIRSIGSQSVYNSGHPTQFILEPDLYGANGTKSRNTFPKLKHTPGVSITHSFYSKMGWTIMQGLCSKIQISWPRPHDGKILTASFEISVEEGATQTGGTTTSGDHGGSHHSGNF